MTKRRLAWVAGVWVVTAVVATGWVVARTDETVTSGDALLVGIVVATLLSAVVATIGRG